MENWIIIYKANGEDLNLSIRHIGPFPSFEAAYEVHCTLPAPINGGHKFIEQLEPAPPNPEPIPCPSTQSQSTPDASSSGSS